MVGDGRGWKGDTVGDVDLGMYVMEGAEEMARRLVISIVRAELREGGMIETGGTNQEEMLSRETFKKLEIETVAERRLQAMEGARGEVRWQGSNQG